MSEWNARQNWHSPAEQSPQPLLIPQRHSHLEKHLPYRTWSIRIIPEYHRKAHQSYFKIHLVCYNILSQRLLEENSFLYENCFRRNLQWFRRRDRLMREFERQDADILCLQEMQCDHYENDFRGSLRSAGYESIYLKRSGDKPDGCCIFYKINRLKLIASHAVPFYQRNIPVLDRDNCGLIALFQPLVTNATSEDLFCVATTHLLFSPKRGDIKLAQIQYFLAEIDRFAMQDPQTNTHYPIILCGDFNSHPQSPDSISLTGSIKYDTYRCIDISGQLANSTGFSYPLPSTALLPPSFVSSDCRLVGRIQIKQHTSAVLTHDKQFRSVYELENTSDVTANEKFLDYIFYTDRLSVLSRLELYNENQMQDVHMPNHQFPSDHFLLSVKFALQLR